MNFFFLYENFSVLYLNFFIDDLNFGFSVSKNRGTQIQRMHLHCNIVSVARMLKKTDTRNLHSRALSMFYMCMFIHVYVC